MPATVLPTPPAPLHAGLEPSTPSVYDLGTDRARGPPEPGQTPPPCPRFQVSIVDAKVAGVRFLSDAIPPSLATAVGISGAAHLAAYVLTPVLSLHVVALGGTSTQVGLLFSTFALVAVVLRPAAGAWIDRQGARRALLSGATVMVLSSLGLQVATAPAALTAAMAGFGVGFGLTTMAAAVHAASAPAEQRGRALGVYYLAAPVSMAMAAPLSLWLFANVGAGATFAMVTVLGVAAAAFGLS